MLPIIPALDLNVTKISLTNNGAETRPKVALRAMNPLSQPRVSEDEAVFFNTEASKQTSLSSDLCTPAVPGAFYQSSLSASLWQQANSSAAVVSVSLLPKTTAALLSADEKQSEIVESTDLGLDSTRSLFTAAPLRRLLGPKAQEKALEKARLAAIEEQAVVDAHRLQVCIFTSRHPLPFIAIVLNSPPRSTTFL